MTMINIFIDYYFLLISSQPRYLRGVGHRRRKESRKTRYHSNVAKEKATL